MWEGKGYIRNLCTVFSTWLNLTAINKVLLCVHLKIYTNIKSLYYTPETNPVLLLIHITNITLHQFKIYLL